MKVESAAGLEGLGEELAVDAVLVSSTSIIIHTDNDGSMRTSEKLTENYLNQNSEIGIGRATVRRVKDCVGPASL